MNIIEDKPINDFKLFRYLFLSDLKSFLIISSASSLITISLFKCITRSSCLSLEEVKLIAIVNWIFHMLNFLKLFMMSFKYSLILLRYSATDSVLFLSPLLYIQYSCYSKNCLLLLVYYSFLLLHAQNYF